jgi:hypothetical protein
MYIFTGRRHCEKFRINHEIISLGFLIFFYQLRNVLSLAMCGEFLEEFDA